MEAFIYFILKSSLLLSGFYLVYHFLLRKETFFQANRWFLWLGFVVSLVLPFISIVKTVVVEVHVFQPIETLPVYKTATETFAVDWIELAFALYVIGLFFFLMKFILNLMQLVKNIRKHTFKKLNNLLIANDESIQSPYSFFNFVFLNTTDFGEKETAYIFKHEQAHAEGFHSIDLLFANLFTVFFWFNPFAWLYKKAIEQNLEFIADESSIASKIDKNQYQLTLLKSFSIEAKIPLTHPFYQSFLKNRIVMMNQRKSHRFNQFRYMTILPLLVVFFLLFQIKTVAQYRESNAEILKNLSEIEVLINSKTKKQELESNIQYIKEKTGIDVTVDTKRNSSGIIDFIDIGFVNSNGNHGGITQKVENGNGILPIKISAKLLDNGLYELNAIPVLFKNEETADTNSIDLLKIDSIIPNVHGKNVFVYSKNETAQPKMQDTTKLKILLIVNGKKLISKINQDELNDLIDPNIIDNVNVLKGKQATDKYGAEAKDGAIEITTKEVPKEALENIEKGKETLLKGDYPQDIFFMLNGKRSSKAEIEKISPDKIKSINVLKGKNATDKYGRLGENGVIEVFTKIF